MRLSILAAALILPLAGVARAGSTPASVEPAGAASAASAAATPASPASPANDTAAPPATAPADSVPADASSASAAGEADQKGDIHVTVTLASTAQSGLADATVKIHADRRAVWALLTSCASVAKLVPGLVECAVIASAPDGSWQLIRQVIDYSWYVPRLTLVFRADYRYPSRITMQRVSGNLRVFSGSWDLDQAGDFTIVHYSLALAPGFWAPRWLVRAALRRDLPKMLRALRSLAEGTHQRGTDDE